MEQTYRSVSVHPPTATEFPHDHFGSPHKAGFENGARIGSRCRVGCRHSRHRVGSLPRRRRRLQHPDPGGPDLGLRGFVERGDLHPQRDDPQWGFQGKRSQPGPIDLVLAGRSLQGRRRTDRNVRRRGDPEVRGHVGHGRARRHPRRVRPGPTHGREAHADEPGNHLGGRQQRGLAGPDRLWSRRQSPRPRRAPSGRRHRQADLDNGRHDLRPVQRRPGGQREVVAGRSAPVPQPPRCRLPAVGPDRQGNRPCDQADHASGAGPEPLRLRCDPPPGIRGPDDVRGERERPGHALRPPAHRGLLAIRPLLGQGRSSPGRSSGKGKVGSPFDTGTQGDCRRFRRRPRQQWQGQGQGQGQAARRHADHRQPCDSLGDREAEGPREGTRTAPASFDRQQLARPAARPARPQHGAGSCERSGNLGPGRH